MRVTKSVALAAIAATVLLSGCGSSSSSSASDGKCQKVENGAVTVVSKSISFTPDCLEMAPGDLTVTYDNEEKGISHNFHLEGATPKEADKDRTVLKPGVDTQTVSYVDLQPGTYRYICDLHPTMTGKLIVEAPTASTTLPG